MIVKNIILVVIGYFSTIMFFATTTIGVKNLLESKDVGLLQCGASFFLIITITECVKEIIKEKGE